MNFPINNFPIYQLDNIFNVIISCSIKNKARGVLLDAECFKYMALANNLICQIAGKGPL